MLAVLHLPRKCTSLRDILLILFLVRSRRLVIQKRAFNDFYLRDLFKFDGLFGEVGKWNGFIFVYGFFWKPGRI